MTMLVATTRVCDINQDNSNCLKIMVHRHGDTKVRSYNEKSHGATCAATAQLLQHTAQPADPVFRAAVGKRQAAIARRKRSAVPGRRRRRRMLSARTGPCSRSASPRPRGDERILTILGPGSIVGELAIIDGGARSATVVAIRDCKLSFISREAFVTRLREYPEIYSDLVSTLVSRLREADDAMAAASFLTVKAPVRRALLWPAQQ